MRLSFFVLLAGVACETTTLPGEVPDDTGVALDCGSFTDADSCNGAEQGDYGGFCTPVYGADACAVDSEGEANFDFVACVASHTTCTEPDGPTYFEYQGVCTGFSGCALPIDVGAACDPGVDCAL